MKIAVTSRSFSSNEFLKRKILSKYKDVKFNTSGNILQGEELYKFLSDVDGAIVALETIDRELLSRLPNLRVISKFGVGLDNLDLAAMKEAAISLGHCKGANKRSVSELALSFSISMLRGVYQTQSEVHRGRWKQYVGRQLTGKTFGILGLGNVGQDLVMMLRPFNCKILACDIDDRSLFSKEHNIQMVSKEMLFKESQVLSIHIPLNENSKNLVDSSLLSLMREDSILINTSRGGIVNEVDLEKALRNEEILGAAFDVLSEEPPLDNPLLELKNFSITPHIGGSSKEAILAMGEGAILGLSQFIDY